MERMIIHSLLVGTFQISQAGLPHAALAPVNEHMHEVNVQWTLQGQVPEGALKLTSFPTEAERIRHHLLEVRRILGGKAPVGLSTTQLKWRGQLLDRLAVYAEGGVFPWNHVLPYRNPVFMDPYGTACAVGHLMIESGHGELASRISAEMNTAYVLDMNWPEIFAWANEHGFTAEELAWIQPGYPPALPWMPLGGGTNGMVTALEVLSNGDLLVAGNFSEAGGATMAGVAIWDGTSYTPLGNPILGEVTSVAEHDGAIYVGGSAMNGGQDLARWDGTTWTYHTIMEGKWPHITALHVHDGELYAAGTIQGFAGEDHVVRRVNSDHTHTQMGSALDGRILALESHAGELVAGGEFTGILNETDPLISHLAVFQAGEWIQLSTGVDAPVRSLLSDGDDLHIGGDLFVNMVVTFGLAKLDGLSGEIEPQLPNHGLYAENGTGPSYIGAMVKHGDDLYVTGSFSLFDMMLVGRTTARVTGVDMIEPMMSVQEPGHALAIHGQRLVVGGGFSGYDHIAALDLSTGVNDGAELMLALVPNPAVHQVIVRSTGSGLPAALDLFDAVGRKVNVPVVRRTDALVMDVRSLTPGNYHVRMTVDGEIHAGRFVKE